eukprot:186009-Amphidinium_carterae.1
MQPRAILLEPLLKKSYDAMHFNFLSAMSHRAEDIKRNAKDNEPSKLIDEQTFLFHEQVAGKQFETAVKNRQTLEYFCVLLTLFLAVLGCGGGGDSG